jgi:hypothetical protein
MSGVSSLPLVNSHVNVRGIEFATFLWPFWRYLICSEYFIPNCLRIRSCIVLNVAGMSNVVIHRIFGIYYLFYICKVWCLLIDIKKNKKIPHCRYQKGHKNKTQYWLLIIYSTFIKVEYDEAWFSQIKNKKIPCMLEHFQNPIQKSKKEANSIHNTHKCMTDHFSVLAELVLWTHIFALSEMMRSCKCFHV